MKRIFILLFLLSNITWLTGCAAVDPAVQNCVQKNVTFQELPGELRARIICKMFPELVQFLTNHYANKARLEIASFEPGARIFGINRLNSQLIIARYRYDIGGVGTLVTWDLNTHRPLQHRTFNESNLEPLIIPNKNKIAVIDIHHQASLLDMNDFTKLCDLGEAFNMAISQDETRLVTVNYQTFCLWDVETGRKINEFPHALNECLLGLSQAHLAMNSCGTKLALATFDTIYIIDLITGRTFLKILPVGCTRYPQFSSDGTKLYAEVDRPGAFFYKAWMLLPAIK